MNAARRGDCPREQERRPCYRVDSIGSSDPDVPGTRCRVGRDIAPREGSGRRPGEAIERAFGAAKEKAADQGAASAPGNGRPAENAAGPPGLLRTARRRSIDAFCSASSLDRRGSPADRSGTALQFRASTRRSARLVRRWPCFRKLAQARSRLDHRHAAAVPALCRCSGAPGLSRPCSTASGSSRSIRVTPTHWPNWSITTGKTTPPGPRGS